MAPGKARCEKLTLAKTRPRRPLSPNGGHPPSNQRARKTLRCIGLENIANGGAGGIRTLDRALQPYNGLANRRLQPLGHSSIRADMPDEANLGKQRRRSAGIGAHKAGFHAARRADGVA